MTTRNITRVSVALMALLATAAITQARRVRAAALFPTPWIFGMTGLTTGQTMRVNVVNLIPPPDPEAPPGPCHVVLSFLDPGGQPFKDSTGQVIQSDVQLQAGESAFLDLNGDAVVPPSTNGAPQRLQLRPVVNVLQEPSGKYPPGPCFPTMEVFDNATGRTSLFAQAILPGHPVRH